MRKLILIGGLLCTLTALCAEESSLRAVEPKIVPLSEIHCPQCALLVYPHVAVVRLEADSIAVDQATGFVRLVGSVRVKFRDGRELQAQSMTMKTTSQGLNEFRGDEMRMVPAASR